MGLQRAQLTGSRVTKIELWLPNADGELEKVVYSPTHKRITPKVSNEVAALVDEVSLEMTDFTIAQLTRAEAKKASLQKRIQGLTEEDAEPAEPKLATAARPKKKKPGSRLADEIRKAEEEDDAAVEQAEDEIGDGGPLAHLRAEDMPRNSIVAQLVFLVEKTDIWDNGKELPPTRETYEDVDTSALRATLSGIQDTAVPKKSGLENSSGGTQRGDVVAAPRKG